MATTSFSSLDAVPCVWMRGGTSKAAFFHASDLPVEPAARDALILAAMGHPDARQIDGIGGGHPLTTKVAFISRSQDARADVDYLFGQVVAAESRIDYAPTCGNILAAVGPFALEEGLVAAQPQESVVRIRMVNTNSYCDAVVQTPGGRVAYSGDTHISGVPGEGSPIELRFSDIVGSSCGALLPTGEPTDRIDGVEVTCVDNGMPVVVMRAADLGCTGNETPAELDANTALKARIESIRLQAGQRMGLGDVSVKVVPKMTLVSPAQAGGSLNTRTFIPRKCHDAIGVLGAVSVASACVLSGTVTEPLCRLGAAPRHDLSVEHPTGEFTVRLLMDDSGLAIAGAALLRTARPLFRGQVLVPPQPLIRKLDPA
ncbi:4-oxalomesaconate tautomerase [Variovorax sp. J22R115]|uniref:4-oxalomesaconate tautomerase n=1 Tax=Variovorax sp. J22R115 TaxID=3053509 RepID=UPI002574AF3C|nr:4-oxalomesaconate tautomerase [Variovorax sp. J22R115]MDM0050161.1 4-oxalomesaconate tautomerase [Variovorax sp. J22R115]